MEKTTAGFSFDCITCSSRFATLSGLINLPDSCSAMNEDTAGKSLFFVFLMVSCIGVSTFPGLKT